MAATETSDQTPSYESLEGFIAARPWLSVRRLANPVIKLPRQAQHKDYDVGGFRINLRAGVLDLVRAIDLVTITAEGKASSADI
jgi:hypothetical protein